MAIFTARIEDDHVAIDRDGEEVLFWDAEEFADLPAVMAAINSVHLAYADPELLDKLLSE